MSQTPSQGVQISIHTPLTGSDVSIFFMTFTMSLFQSTLPSRGVTKRQCSPPPNPPPFQSTLPSRGVTTLRGKYVSGLDQFQSTLPSRGVTTMHGAVDGVTDISIHTPLTGSDIQRSDGTTYGGISIHTPLTGSDSSRGR